ncbi:MAG: hypothetical protein II273_08375, partial [Lachnospiraceae bacterium]|nr:hypothetical protein [Lachnospiraceae bacterium]
MLIKKLEKQQEKNIVEYALIFLILVIMAWMIKSFETQEYEYQRYETANIHYVKAQVMDIVEQELTLSGAEGEYFTGKQTVIVEIVEGNEKGKKCEIDNHITVQ